MLKFGAMHVSDAQGYFRALPIGAGA